MASNGDQAEILSLLASEEAYGGGGQQCHIVETHISRVLLLGPFALKLKRPVRLPYIDLSTAALRLEMCERELTLNRRTAPDLYRRVRRITREPGGGLALDGDGELVDAVLEMRRFDEAGTFDKLAGRAALTPPLIEELAAAIAALHADAAISTDPHGAARMSRVLAVNERGFAASPILPAEDVSAVTEACRSALQRHAAMLDARAAGGSVRRCHGDLHLRNICLVDDRPLLFDCLEFDEDLATTDVLYDLAFVLMDLWHQGLQPQANRLFNRYLDLTGDEEGIGLLPFLMAVRAAVRAHVAAAECRNGNAAKGDEARAYLTLCRDLLSPRAAALVAVGGFSGSGKSTVAAAIASRIGPAPGARIAASDRIRKRLHGVSPQTRLPAEAYAPEVSARVYAAQAQMAAISLRHAHGAVADAVFDRADDRRRIAAVGAQAGVRFHGLWLEAPAETLTRRVAARRGDPSDATAAVVQAQIERNGAPADWTVITAGGDRDSVAAAALAAVTAAG